MDGHGRKRPCMCVQGLIIGTRSKKNVHRTLPKKIIRPPELAICQLCFHVIEHGSALVIHSRA
jgi:hypothetical protein